MKKKRNELDVTADPFLLTCLSSTYPAPLQVSTPQTPVTGLLHIAAINQGTQPVYCNKVLVAGNTNVGGTLGVNGQTNLGNASVGGILGVTGQTNLGSATVGGSLEVMGHKRHTGRKDF
jgi:hypothetical protein